MDDWTWRQTVASWFYRIGHLLSPDEAHDILVRNEQGNEIFSIAFVGGFVASGPPKPYTLHRRHYADDDDMVGTVEDL